MFPTVLRIFLQPSLRKMCTNLGKFYIRPRQVWIEDLVTEKKVGLISLHADIFGTYPRIDIIHENITWQRLYRHISYANTKISVEVRGGGRKPHAQKGLGIARHGSIRSPLFRKGGISHGPRSPTPYFYMLPFYNRILGLTSTLSVKLAQDDLYIVKELEIPNDDPSFILELSEKRNWGPSILFVNSNSTLPQNITIATNSIKHINLMPA
ncbi:PREDICTED: 39S ribosomal protein L4, mitochondrial [Ceratosolen solmsi marchali]|uniref:Large ribosomal subunit protein uL4m n=1 Tax=Ceratosolen solmsi marchali TaxID=326594 RepID=A0AAJ6YDE7_9HYME|nr:PREDICTED: 39S ribosomal protein L4, mitochondrial [Ceratosolen solmsi marchali]